MKNVVLLAFASALLAAGCVSNKTEKATLERGWIGGEFRQAQRGLLPAGQRRAVYVKQVYAGTPSDQAGLKSADLIVAVNGQPTPNLRDFRRAIDGASPGSRTALRVLRAGQPLELPVTVGREKFQHWHSLSLGLGLSSRVDLWPDRDFTLLSVVQYRFPSERVEMNSAEIALAKQAATPVIPEGPGIRSDEGWSVRLLLFGADGHKRILVQEAVPPSSASVRDSTSAMVSP